MKGELAGVSGVIMTIAATMVELIMVIIIIIRYLISPRGGPHLEPPHCRPFSLLELIVSPETAQRTEDKLFVFIVRNALVTKKSIFRLRLCKIYNPVRTRQCN